jgi:hypothetical protein
MNGDNAPLIVLLKLVGAITVAGAIWGFVGKPLKDFVDGLLDKHTSARTSARHY